MLLFPVLSGCGGGRESGRIDINGWECIEGGAGVDRPGNMKNGWKPYRQGLPVNKDILTFKVNGDRTLWLAGRFTVEGTPKERYGLIVRGRNRNAPLFINGFLLKRHEERRLANVYSPAAYQIPGALLKKGINTIHVKASTMAGYTAVTDNMELFDEDVFAGETTVNEIVYTQFPLAILIFNLSLLFPPLIFFFWNRWARVLAYASMVLLVYIIYILFQFVPPAYTGSAVPRIHLALIPVFGILLFVSVQSLYRIYLTLFIRITAAVCMVTSLMIMTVNKTWAEIYAPYVLLSGIVSILPLSIVILNMINRIKKDRFQFYMLVLFILSAGLLGGYEVIAFAADNRYVFLSPIYSSPALVIIFIILASREFMKNTVKMQLLYNTIGKEDRSVNDPTITDMTEGKLKSVIEFINRNYRQDISREGLAGAIDMSTDYMSRLFRKYTGKKINEYINELRVRDAMTMLEDRKIKIIDIALSVGFESLSTFNRAFKVVTGITPTTYRSRPKTGGQ